MGRGQLRPCQEANFPKQLQWMGQNQAINLHLVAFSEADNLASRHKSLGVRLQNDCTSLDT